MESDFLMNMQGFRSVSRPVTESSTESSTMAVGLVRVDGRKTGIDGLVGQPVYQCLCRSQRKNTKKVDG